MPAAGTRTSSSRIVVSGSLRWPPPLRGPRSVRSVRSVRSRSRSRPRRRRLRRLPSAPWSSRPCSPRFCCWSLRSRFSRFWSRFCCWSPRSRFSRFWSRFCCWSPRSRFSRFWSRFAVLAAAAVPVLVAALVVARLGARGSRSRGSGRPARRGRGPRPGSAAPRAACSRVLLGLLLAALGARRPRSAGRASLRRPESLRGAESLPGAESVRAPAPDCAPLIASMSWAFFMVAAPGMPMPAAIDFRSAISMELSPPPRFLGAPAVASGPAGVDSMVSVT